MKKTLLCASSLVLPALWSTSAGASGFSTARFGGEHGNPVTTNPTAIYYNPAGIAESTGYHIFVDGNLALRSSSYTHTPSPTDTPEPKGAEGANTDEATLFNVVAAPMLGATAKFGDLAVGAGFYVPFGGMSKWDTNDKFDGNNQLPGAVDGAQRWATIEGSLQSMYMTLAAAYQIPKTGLSLGVSGNLIRSQIRTIRARNADGSNSIANVDSERNPTDVVEGRSLVDVSGWQGSFGVGAMYQAMPDKLWLGLSYQARPNISGGMTLSGTLTNNLAGTPTPAEDIDVTQDLPDIIRLGARFKPSPELELRLFGDFTRWSSLERHCLGTKGKECKVAEDGATPKLADGSDDPNVGTLQNIPRDWQDAFGVRAGASYWLSPPIELFGGAGYDGSAVPDETLEPSLSDFNKISVAVGGRFAIGDHLHAALSYTQLIYLSRDTSGVSKAAGYKVPSRSPDAGGEYSQSIGVVNANVDVAF
jgi:long-chain fatty acid transport protein